MRCSQTMPGRLGLLARVDVAVRAHQLGRVHRGVADDRHLPALVELAEQVAGRHRRAAQQARVAVDVVVDAVVEVVGAEVAQAALLVERGEQPAHGLVVRVHRAADVHEQEQPHVVLALGPEDELDLARVAARLVDRLVEVELVGPALCA